MAFSQRIQMKIGISTASCFGKLSTEEALKFFKENQVATSEVFLQSFSEYNKKFAKSLIKKVGKTDIHSIHVLTTQLEPTLYSLNKVAQKDSFEILEGVLQAGKVLNATHYTFHGGAIFKKTPTVLNYQRIGEITQRIIDRCSAYGIILTYENVHWGYYNHAGFFKEVSSRCQGLKATLDIKQARQSGIAVKDYIMDMGENIETVHLSDIREDGKMCLPGKGNIDFNELMKMLKDVNFDGAMLIEAYGGDYEDKKELIESYEFIKEKAYKIF